jgi:hypothetical protein
MLYSYPTNTYDPPPLDGAASMMIVNDWLPVNPSESVTVMVNVNVAVTLGVPEMIPVVGASDVPVGSVPEVTAKV